MTVRRSPSTASALLLVLLSSAVPSSAFVQTRPFERGSVMTPRRRPSAPSSLSESSPAASSSSSSSSSSSPPVRDCSVVPTPPETRSASAVIFDIDGTLADSWRLGYDATVVVLENNSDKVLGGYDGPITEAFYHETCVHATPERLARTAGYDPSHPDFDVIGEELGRQFDEHYVALVSKKTAGFYDGVIRALENVPDSTKLGALTNACVAYGRAVLEVNCPVRSAVDNTYGGGFALYGRFGTIHGADSVPAPKPSPEGLLQCAGELGDLDPKTCVYVGDSPGDGRAARAAGMVSVGVTWGSNSEEKLRDAEVFDYICRDVDELRSLLPQV
mmetsp:Transcript_903/g.1829  ORF Transcript_903/g.1829 Transcript_903/m.1829 type:complete len:331 (-) Transcript_903:426-1418(-)